MDQHYTEWREAALSGTYTPMSEEEIEKAFTWTTCYGSPNCWTGTVGRACKFIRQLLREREWLLAELRRKNS